MSRCLGFLPKFGPGQHPWDWFAMSDAGRQNGESGNQYRRFATTHWSKVFVAGDERSPESGTALEWLCERYWSPVYAYLRQKRHPPEASRDLTQGFFAFLIEHHAISKADPARGRFRTFLIACLENCLAVQRRHEAAVTRGVTQPFMVWDEALAERLYQSVLVHSDTPDRLFEKRWAIDLLERVYGELRMDFSHLAKSDLLEKLEGHLWGDPEAAAYEVLSKELGLSAGALRLTVHRLRRHFRQLLIAEIAATGVPEDEIEVKIRHLLDLVSS